MYSALSKLSLILIFFCPIQLFAQGEGCFGETFVQLWSDESGRDLRPTCALAYPGASGDILLGGTVGGDIFLSRIDNEGKPRWQRVIVTSSESTELSTLNELIVDRAGMIAGVGATFNDNLQKAYLFRYDPNQDELMYFVQPNYPSEATGLSELVGGEYLITGSKQGEAFPVFISAMMHRINQANGQPITEGQRYDFLGDEAFLDAAVAEDGSIYTVGNVSATGGAGDIRAMISRFSPEGAPLWTQIGPVPGTSNARLYAFDLEIVGDKLYVLHWGSIGVVTGGLNTSMLLSRLNISDGSVDWTRRYDITEYNGESPIELVAQDGRLFTYGFSLIGKRDPWLMQLDLEGVVNWSYSYLLAGNANVYLRANQQLLVGNEGIFTLASFDNPGESARTGAVLSLTDEGRSNTECLELRSLTVEVSSLSNGWGPILLDVNALATNWLPEATDREASTLVITDDCNRSCDRCESTSFSRTAVCRGDSLLLNGRFLSIAGVYTDTFPGVLNACDSIHFTELAFSDGPEVTYSILGQCGLSTAEVRLSVSGGEFPYSFTWSDPSALGDTPTLPPGNYRVTVNDAIGCRPSVVDIVVDLANRQTLSFLAEAPACTGDSSGTISLSPSGRGSLRLIPDGAFLPGRIEGLPPGSYGVILRDSTGCEAFRQVTVPDAVPAEVSISTSPYIRLGETVSLMATSVTGTNFVDYQWTALDSISCSDCPVAQFRPVADVVLTLQTTTDRGCVVTDSILLSVLDGAPRIYLPTAFSPNGDGINDRWLPGLGPEVEALTSCQIFNRWGGMVWEYAPGENWWDGDEESPGTFTYQLTARLINGESVRRAGTIVLLK
ncbi:T9SS type B sorting domain-containing protein [Neolewinella persica]|uniref:T9SS type B sorting domain-containing protein n=1 Tax=Neolewinella persica TaxID=70998 RepID=UPI00037A38AA|nr:gliding motility-associated C-terminal domain-containing protein [Neolewinella persica]